MFQNMDFPLWQICLQVFLKRASNSLFCQTSTHICNYFRKNRNFLIPWYKGWVITSQIPYSGGLQDLHGNSNFLSLFFLLHIQSSCPITSHWSDAGTCNLQVHPRMPKSKSKSITLNLWGWISGLEPFLAFSASAPLQKLRLTWKTLDTNMWFAPPPVLTALMGGVGGICRAQSTTHLFIVSREYHKTETSPNNLQGDTLRHDLLVCS